MKATSRIECKPPVTRKEPLLFSLAQTNVLAELLIEKEIISQPEFLAKIAEKRTTYQRLLNPTLTALSVDRSV